MHDAFGVSVGQAFGRLSDEIQCLCQLDPAGPLHQLLQVLPFDVLHYHIVSNPVLADVIDLDLTRLQPGDALGVVNASATNADRSIGAAR